MERIVVDEFAESPREWDNLGTLWTQERDYASPDPIPQGAKPPAPRTVIDLPVWRYSHGGTQYAAAHSNPFHCPWDSGQVGKIFVTKEDLRKEFGWKRISPQRRAKVEALLKAEVETYSQWASGEVYSVYDETEDIWIGGFFGIEEAEAALKEVHL